MTDLSIQTLPDPHIDAPTTRRRFTVANKLRILREADQCTQHGQLGALLRREALYASTLASFRKQYEEGNSSPKTICDAHKNVGTPLHSASTISATMLRSNSKTANSRRSSNSKKTFRTDAPDPARRAVDRVSAACLEETARVTGVQRAYDAVASSRASFYRKRKVCQLALR